MIDKIYICTSKDQALPAKIAKFSFQNYLEPSIEIEIINNENLPYLAKITGKEYLRRGKKELFNPNDMQSFTLARFCIPKLMGYKGNALVIDPDIFLVSPHQFRLHKDFCFDKYAIFCRKNNSNNSWASSSMFLNCSKLKHWKIEDFINQLIDRHIDYFDLINLIKETADICEIPRIWNDFDNLDNKSILLHLTQKDSQPWRTGLRLNTYIPPILGLIPRAPIYRLFGRNLNIGREHPNDNISNLFFTLFRECIKTKIITEDEIDTAIADGFLRQDIKNIVLSDST